MLKRDKFGKWMKDKTLVGRDKNIIRDYIDLKNKGMTMLWMVNKYQMSSSNIYLILKKYGVLDNKEK